ncbi:MAG TPA: PIG-L deacetylase family protein, partial [Acidimicrobiales bacterium]|nr:PIG-L deacetylase family protein [Acidimicrobiales bacterium]
MNPNISIDLPVPERVLAIGAHPDDIEFNCGATIAKWSDQGAEVHLLVLTDGSMGSWDRSSDRSELIDARKSECRSAASLLGVEPHRIEFLGYPDGSLKSGDDEKSEVCNAIRHVRPDVVITHDPWKRYRLHPDHRWAGFIVVDALVAAREVLYTRGQVKPAHRPSALLLFEPDVVDHVEDVTGYLPRKTASLLAHESQHLSTMGIRGLSDSEGMDRFRSWVDYDLQEKGSLADISAGEAFKLIS